MIQGRSYAPEDSMYPLAGLDLLAPSTMISPSATPLCQNMIARNGIAVKRNGYIPLGTGLPNEPVQALIEFEIDIDVRILVAVTPSHFCSYNTSTKAWDEIRGSTHWTGDQTNNIDWVVARGLDGDGNDKKWLIVTNGKDKPQYWDGVAGTFADYPCNLASFVTFKTIAQFYDHIVIGNVQTSNFDHQLIAWTTVGSLVDFTNFSTGDSGSEDVTGASGDIVKLKNMGDRLIIYAENSISSMSYIGAPFVFSLEQVVKEIRLLGPQAIVDLGPYHIFIGQENWYVYDGERAVYPAGDAVWKLFKDELFTDQKNRAFGFFDQPHNYIYWGVPIGDGLMVIYQQEYNLITPKEVRWTRTFYTDQPFCMGFFSRDEALRWNSPQLTTMPWSAANFTWLSAEIRKGFPNPVIGSQGKVFVTDGTSLDDNGVAQLAFWDTKDFTIPQAYESQLARWCEIECELAGNACRVYYSLDQGQSYVQVKDLTLTSNFARYRMTIDKTSRNIRLRFANGFKSSTFSMRWARVWFRPGGAW